MKGGCSLRKFSYPTKEVAKGLGLHKGLRLFLLIKDEKNHPFG